MGSMSARTADLAERVTPRSEAMPLVSVGLPVYNGERFLSACLDSLVAQVYPNYEIIVSDNASTDATARICEEHARRDGRIRYVRADRNRGAAWNHNRVIELARGDFVKWCGADDVFHPSFLRACVDALQARPDAVLAFPRTVVIDEVGRPVNRTTDHLPVESPDVVVRFRSLLSALSVTQNLHYGVIRQASLHRVRPLGSFLAADRCFLGELALIGPFVEIPEYLMFRRQHTGNLQRTRVEEQRLYNPADDTRYRSRELRVLREHLTAIARASVSVGTKLRLLSGVACWAFAERLDMAYESRLLLRQAVRQLGSRWGRAVS